MSHVIIIRNTKTNDLEAVGPFPERDDAEEYLTWLIEANDVKWLEDKGFNYNELQQPLPEFAS
jgi:hypothetical protein